MTSPTDSTASGTTASPTSTPAPPAPSTPASHTPGTAGSRPTTALVTGANKGTGFEIAAGLGALGWSVGVGARDAARREAAVQRLRDAGYDAFGVPLDVTDDDSVAAAAALLQERGGLDVLVNNAGITGGMPQLPSEVTVEQLRDVLDVNVFGVVRTMQAFLPQLRRSGHPRVVTMSSGVGSLARQAATSDPLATGPVSGAYSPSKTYLNAVTLQFVKELAERGEQRILVNLACPASSPRTSTTSPASAARRRARRSPSGWRRCPTTARPGATSRTRARSPGEPGRPDRGPGTGDRAGRPRRRRRGLPRLSGRRRSR